MPILKRLIRHAFGPTRRQVINILFILITITLSFSAQVALAGKNKMDVCHHSSSGTRIINIAEPALPAHFAHGDFLVVPEICGDSVDNDCDGTADGPLECSQVVDCRTNLQPPVQGLCSSTPGTDGLAIRGTILGPNTVYIGGEVLVDDKGFIQCVGCDCSESPGAGDAMVLTCPEGVISPGLINAHDHISFAHNAPRDHGTEKYEHRHDWRKGLRGHTKITVNPSSQTESVDRLAQELRHLMAGATSMLGIGGQSGLLRNIDDTDEKHTTLFNLAPINNTFPLDDGIGILNASGCSYGPLFPDFIDAVIFGLDDGFYESFIFHAAEGIDPEAHNEINCLQPAIRPDTAVIHGIALNADDTELFGHNQTFVIWSPRSNMDLYGNTAPVSLLKASGVPMALGTDWLPSGSMNLQRELSCARDLNSKHFDYVFSDFQLWQMVTTNAALVAGWESGIGILKPGNHADIAVFDGRSNSTYGSVISADLEDVVLVLRGGEVLYGDAALVDSWGGACELMPVCGSNKKACVAEDVGYATLADLQAAANSLGSYPLFFCDEPADEPSCLPSRPGEYDGLRSKKDKEGDGVKDGKDLCPSTFDPIRPMDGGTQADSDGDGIGDACDTCPTDATNSCTPRNTDDLDGDGVPNGEDNCPTDVNPTQADSDGDRRGDACDAPVPVVAVEDIRDDPDFEFLFSRIRMTDLYVTAVDDSAIWAQKAPEAPNNTPEPYTGIELSFDFYLAIDPRQLVEVGNRISVEGYSLDDEWVFGYAGFDFIAVRNLQVTDPGTVLPFSPIDVTPEEIKTGGPLVDGYESMLLRARHASVVDLLPQYGEIEIASVFELPGLRIDDQIFSIFDNLNCLSFDPFTDLFSVTGVLGFSFDDSKLWPRQCSDYQPDP